MEEENEETERTVQQHEGEESEEKDEHDTLKENMVTHDDNLIVKT